MVRSHDNGHTITYLTTNNDLWKSLEEKKALVYKIGLLHNFDGRVAKILLYSEKFIRIKSDPVFE